MKNVCVYHSADLDGVCSAAIVLRAVPDCELMPWDYGDDIPWGKLEGNNVYMVDVSFPPQYMDALAAMSRLIWIDHHERAIHAMSDDGGTGIDGLQEVGRGACELAWQYFNPKESAPMGVWHIGRHDVWDHSDSNTLAFQFGMRATSWAMDPKAYGEDFFTSLVGLDAAIMKGRTILDYDREQATKLSKGHAFETSLLGLSAVAMNTTVRGSLQFASVFKGHDLMIPFGRRADGQWRFSFYSENPEIDCSEIAATFGGGGHKSAAGCVVTLRTGGAQRVDVLRRIVLGDA